MAKIYKAPEPAPRVPGQALFLAGSIDMGAAIDWQAMLTERLADLPVMIFNPRRDGWDSSWEQDISNDPFREQVEWELDHLARSSVIAFYFDASGKAPITLMELGLHAASGRCIVYCPKNFWRSGNVQIVCQRYGIPLFQDDEDGFVAAIRERLL
jgi:hypothetical protein